MASSLQDLCTTIAVPSSPIERVQRGGTTAFQDTVYKPVLTKTECE